MSLVLTDRVVALTLSGVTNMIKIIPFLVNAWLGGRVNLCVSVSTPVGSEDTAIFGLHFKWWNECMVRFIVINSILNFIVVIVWNVNFFVLFILVTFKKYIHHRNVCAGSRNEGYAISRGKRANFRSEDRWKPNETSETQRDTRRGILSVLSDTRHKDIGAR